MESSLLNTILIICEIIGFVGGGMVGIVKLFNKLTALETKLNYTAKERNEQHQNNLNRFNNIEEELKELREATLKLVQVQEQIVAINARLQELSNRITNGSRKKLTSRRV